MVAGERKYVCWLCVSVIKKDKSAKLTYRAAILNTMCTVCLCVCCTARSQYVDVEEFVEMTKKYTENITQTPQSEESKQDPAKGGVWDWNDLTQDKVGMCPHTHTRIV